MARPMIAHNERGIAINPAILAKRSDSKSKAEGAESGAGLAGGACRLANGTVVTHRCQHKRDAGPIQGACAGFAAARNVSHLYFATPWQAFTAQLDQVPFADLSVAKIKVTPQAWVVNGRNQPQLFLGAAKWYRRGDLQAGSGFPE